MDPSIILPTDVFDKTLLTGMLVDWWPVLRAVCRAWRMRVRAALNEITNSGARRPYPAFTFAGGDNTRLLEWAYAQIFAKKPTKKQKRNERILSKAFASNCLIEAAKSGLIKCAQLCIGYGADQETRVAFETHHYTAIELAGAHGQTSLVRLLIQGSSGALQSVTAALYAAASHGQLDVIQFALQWFKLDEAKSSQTSGGTTKTLLYITEAMARAARSAKNSTVSVMRELFNYEPAYFKKHNEYTRPILCEAAASGHVPTLEWVIANLGVYPAFPMVGAIEAARNGHVEPISICASLDGANSAEIYEECALTGASEGHLNVVRHCCARTTLGLKQVAMNAAGGGHSAIAIYCVDAGATNATAIVLEMLVQDFAASAVTCIQAFGSKIDKIGDVLRQAASCGAMTAVTACIDRGCDPRALSDALCRAARSSRHEVMHVLKKAGATGYGEAMVEAAKSNDAEGVSICASFGAGPAYLEQAFVVAAREDREKALRECKKLGAVSYLVALRAAPAGSATKYICEQWLGHHA